MKHAHPVAKHFLLLSAVFLALQITVGCNGTHSAFKKPEAEKVPESVETIFHKPDTSLTLQGSVDADRVTPRDLNEQDPHAAMTALLKTSRTAGLDLDYTPSAFAEQIIGSDTTPQRIKFDFINGVTIPEMVSLFAKELNFQYAIDPAGIPGTVSLAMDTQLTRRQIWALLERMLWINNAFISYDEGIVWVRPLDKAGQDSTVPKRSNVAVRLFRLTTVEAKGVAEMLKSFCSIKGQAIEIPGQNSILVMDNVDNMEKMAEIIATVDQITERSWSRTVIPARNVSPVRLAYELEQVMSTLGFPIAAQNSTTTTTSGNNRNAVQTASTTSRYGAIKMTPLDRVPALLVTAANAEAIAEIERWALLLDNDQQEGQAQPYVYPVINGKAEELVEIVSFIFAAESKTLSLTKADASQGDKRNSSSEGARTAAGQQNQSAAALQQRQREEMLKNGPSSPFDVPIKIVADAEHNRLIVSAPPRVYAVVKALLERLDTVPPQVLLEVKIAEVQIRRGLTLGTQFGVANGNNYFGVNNDGMSYSDPMRITGRTANIASSGSSYTDTLVPAGYLRPGNDMNGFNYLWQTSAGNFGFQALQDKSEVTLIASPNILAMSGKSAQVKVGEKVPTITSMYTDGTSSSTGLTTQNAVEYKETGTLLTVTPRITRGGLIQLDLIQETSEAASTTSSSINSPTFKNRRFETTMALRDGGTLLLGGLIRDDKASSVNALPIIADIPWLNALFGKTTDSSKKIELVVIVTAHIIHEATPLEETVNRYYNALNLIRKHQVSRYKEMQQDIAKEVKREEEEREAREHAKLDALAPHELPDDDFSLPPGNPPIVHERP